MNGKIYQHMVIVLVALALLVPAAVPLSAASAPASPLANGEIKLVAQDLIDLAWDPGKYPYPELQFKSWELFRGTSPNPTSSIAEGVEKTQNFFRDTSLAVGTTYYYLLEIVRCVAPCSLPEHDRRYTIFSDSATTGVFQGSVTRDLALTGGVYEIGFGGVGSSAAVEVAPGANLEIDGGAVVRAVSGVSNGGLSARGGSLYLDQVNLQDVSISFGDYYNPLLPGGGWVRSSTLQNCSISLYSSNSVQIDQNQGTVNISADHQAEVTITHNTFEGSIQVNRQASAVISYNSLTNADIEISGYAAAGEPKASALISHNTILNQYKSQGVQVSYSASLTLMDNTIQWTDFHGSEASILIGAYDSGTTLIAQRNSLSGGKIFATWGPKIDISDNVLLGSGSAITIGCVLCGTDTQATGSILRNTLQSGWGLEMWGGSQQLLIQHNCIRDNDPGLITDDAFMTTPVDVRYNYWGAASGPTHPTNPGGSGDHIDGYQVIFKPWDETDTYCRLDPPAPPDLDFQVEQVQMIQVVEGVDTLVEAKPLAIKAVISSRTAVPLPVEVHLSYSGINHDSFYEYSLDKLHPATQQLYQTTTQVSFFEPGMKTVYFFPEQAPFGPTATAQVTIDPSNHIKEFDEANNSRSATQQVVKTFWGNNPQDQTLKVLAVTIDPNMFINHPLYTVMFAPDIALIPDMLPVAPIDYWQQYEKNPPKVFKDICINSKKHNLAEIAKTEYRGLKLAYPDFHRFMLLIRDSWFKELYLSTCDNHVPKVAEHEIWSHSAIPQLVFIEEFAWESGYEAVAGIAHSYGLPLQNNPIPIQGGLEADIRRVVDNSTYQALHQPEVHSVIGTGSFFRKYGWIDTESYRNHIQKVTATSLQAASTSMSSGLVLVSGLIGQDDHVQIDPLFYLPDGAADTPPPGSFAVSFLDGSDTLLYSQDFAVSFELPATAPITQSAFAFALPYFPGTEKVVISKDGAPIGSLQTSAHSPQVQVTYPDGGENLSGEQTITWTVTDLDADPLTYAVLYSANGGTDWETLAIDLNTTSYVWNTDDYPGAQATGRIKVLVSDGFLSAEDLSDGGFSLQNKPPIASISKPFSGAAVTTGDSLYLEGLALDPEDNWLEGASLMWSSNRDGPLGSGNSVDTALTYGDHIITLTASDSQNLSASDQITVSVTSDSDPDLSLSTDIPDNQQTRTVCKAGGLGVMVQNIIAGTSAWIEFYDGDPQAGGRLIGTRKLYAEANSQNQTGLEWVPGSPGEHTIYTRVSAVNTYEANTSNNQTTMTIQVEAGTCPIFLPMLERR